MIYLIFVSFVWAFSFGIIKGQLTGLDSGFVAFARLAISLVVFLPFFRPRGLNAKRAINLILIGAVQYGLMYAAYIKAFQYLYAYQVALFTVFTPIYISVINDILTKNFNARFNIMAALAVLGAGITIYSDIGDNNFLLGFTLLQISNIAFAVGQIYYKRFMEKSGGVKEGESFALLYLGGVLLTGITSLFTTNYAELTLTQNNIFALLYLGAVASGLCFFLWNKGALQVNIGTLAVFNNAKVPLGAAASFFVFGENGDPLKILIGSFIYCAALLLDVYYTRKGTVRA
jgi:drug/metabolite transporter (DMT)-like permease